MARQRIVHEHESDGAEDVVVHIGHEDLVLRRRYEFLSIVNDFLIGFWFLLGSIAFFFPDWKDAGIWLFVLGSAELLARPAIRLVHRIRLRHSSASNWEM